MARTQAQAQVKSKISGGLILSLLLHAICFSFLFVSMSLTTSQPIMVNLLKDPGTGTTIKAGLVNQKAIDMALQKQADEQRLKHEQLEAKLRSEQAQRDAEAAQKALELESLRKTPEIAAKAVADKQALLAKQQEIKEQAKQKLAQMEAVRRDQAKLDAAKKVNAAKQADAQKAQRDRQVAEHNVLIQKEVDRHKAEFAAAVEENRVLSSVFAGDIKCKIRIRLLPDGSLLSVTVVEPSGNPAYDSMSQSAIYKAAPFPMPTDQELYEQLRDIVLSFKNGEQTSDA